MIRVHIWLPDLENVGHASAEINSDDGNEYVSWWPGGDNIFKARAGQSLTYTDDAASEGRDSDKQFDYDNLNSSAAAKWWSEFLAEKEPKYQLGTTNCSWAVVSALKASGADSCFPWHRLLEKHNLKSLRMPDERALFEYCMAVFQLVRSGNTWTFATARPLIDLMDDLLPTWSPRDTHSYCKLLLAGIRGEDLKFPLLGV